ncbi:hypothetical protein [Bordetella bronchiseptica]|uniref:DUF7448 domain-containing protein n=1 Tax=Bordetella bronchiseptica TaxID=518 RepID=UPI0005293BE2|nr:hypothetical protein [Bordetella bronchiseptica]
MAYDVDFSTLKGLTLVSIQAEVDGDEILLLTECGRKFRMVHYQDCCESVYVESIVGDLADLIGTPLLLAEEATSDAPDAGGSETWTFYKLATIHGYVDIRWLGTSNGWYSESVNFEEVTH